MLAPPAAGAWGTWRQRGVAAANRLHRLPPGLPLPLAATLAVNPATAQRLLQDFVPLRPGDTIVLNAPASGVGRAAIALAAASGIRPIAVLRDRPLWEADAEELRALGAALVLRPSSARSPALAAAIAALGSPPLLALDGTGGTGSADVARLLGPGGTLVCYGGMARAPVSLPVSLLIFRDLRVRGFWLTAWLAAASAAQRAASLEALAQAARSGVLQPPPAWEVPLWEGVAAVAAAAGGEGPRGRKLLLVMGE